MIARFCGYTTLRNLRPFEPFFVLYLLEGLRLSFTAVGALLAYERLLTGALELPLAGVADRYGRRRCLVVMFCCNAAAFALFGSSARWGQPLLGVCAAQTVFGLGEALRSGTHKAIILDWLDGRGEREQATAVIALTRVFSKSSAGVAAMLGGALVYATQGFAALFWLSALVSLAGAALLYGYPRELEGEWTRRSGAASAPSPSQPEQPEQPEPEAVGEQEALPSWFTRFRGLSSLPGLVALLLASVLFETQIKLALAYLQPYLAEGARSWGLEVVGGLGALGIGAYYLAQGLAAGASSALSAPTEARCGGRRPALRAVHGLATLAFLVAAGALWSGGLWAGLGALLLLACLQNLRRPILVAELNALTDPYLRATTLSLESQARSWVYGGLALVSGAVADRWGLPAVFSLLAGLLALGTLALLGSPRRAGSAGRPR